MEYKEYKSDVILIHAEQTAKCDLYNTVRATHPTDIGRLRILPLPVVAA